MQHFALVGNLFGAVLSLFCTGMALWYHDGRRALAFSGCVLITLGGAWVARRNIQRGWL